LQKAINFFRRYAVHGCKVVILYAEPLTRTEGKDIYRQKMAVKTLQEIAVGHQRSVDVMRKWWRWARDPGLAGLEERKPDPKPQGTLSRFDKRVVQTALQRIKHSRTNISGNTIITGDVNKGKA
jgi:hypothetical protein